MMRPMRPELPTSMKKHGRAAFALCGGLFAASLLSAGVSHHADLQLAVFTSPAASAASLFLGAARIDDGGDVLLSAGAGLLRVTRECSGVSFWAMLCGLVLFNALRRPFSARSLFVTAALLPCVWLYAVTVNGMRIAASYHVAALFSHGFLARFGAGAHLWTGILFFIPALILLNYSLERSGAYERH